MSIFECTTYKHISFKIKLLIVEVIYFSKNVRKNLCWIKQKWEIKSNHFSGKRRQQSLVPLHHKKPFFSRFLAVREWVWLKKANITNKKIGMFPCGVSAEKTGSDWLRDEFLSSAELLVLNPLISQLLFSLPLLLADKIMYNFQTIIFKVT